MKCILVHLKVKDNVGGFIDYRLATSSFDINLNGQIFTATGDLLKISEDEETAEISKTGVTVEMSGLDPQFQADIDAGGYVRAPIDIYIANVPEGSNVVDTYTFHHRGYCDTPNTAIDYASGTMTIAIETTNIFTDIDRQPDLMRSSLASHSSRHSGDKFFEYIGNGEGTDIWYI